MDKKQIGIGMVILLIASGATYYITESLQENYSLYECYAKDPPVAMLCWKLSKINTNNISTRCYWNLSSDRRYKQCSTGWIPSDKLEIQGEETSLPDREDYQIHYDFTTRQEAEDYITNLKQGITYEWAITKIEQYPYSDKLEVTGIIRIIKGEDILAELLITEVINETATKEEIKSIISDLASWRFENWQPNIIIGRNDKI